MASVVLILDQAQQLLLQRLPGKLAKLCWTCVIGGHGPFSPVHV